MTVSGGDITAVSSDDALNAAGGNDGSGFGGHGMGNTFTPEETVPPSPLRTARSRCLRAETA
ncbi:MAG: hypothetical protein ACLSAF_16920 [Intestinimonas sp.]